MKKLLILALSICSLAAFAQQGRMQEKLEKVNNLKIAYLTKELDLSSAQAEKFWPIYNNYEKELMQTRRSFKQKHLNDRMDGLTDKESKELLDDQLAMETAVIAIRKNYRNEFLKVLSPQQLVTLMEAEKRFNQMLKDKMRARREDSAPRDKNRF
jgi:Spy/CpxP family protein refolding chaperone